MISKLEEVEQTGRDCSICLYEIGMELLCRIEVCGFAVCRRVHDKIPFCRERKKLITLAAVMHGNLIVSTLVNRSWRIFFSVSLFGVLLKGLGAGRDSFQFCIKTKFTHAFYYIVIASIRSVCHWTPAIDAPGNGGLWRVFGDLGMSYSKRKTQTQKPFFSIPRQAAVSWLT